jgi:hypothetical protein
MFVTGSYDRNLVVWNTSDSTNVSTAIYFHRIILRLFIFILKKKDEYENGVSK